MFQAVGNQQKLKMLNLTNHQASKAEWLESLSPEALDSLFSSIDEHVEAGLLQVDVKSDELKLEIMSLLPFEQISRFSPELKSMYFKH